MTASSTDKTASLGAAAESLDRGRFGQFAAVLIPVYLVLVLVGYLWLRHTGVMTYGQEITRDRAFFLATSTATLTGFQQPVGINEFNPDSLQGPLIIIGLTILGSLLAMIIGGLAAVRALRLPYRDRQVIVAAITVEALAILAGSAALVGGSRTLLDSLQLAAAAFGNSGIVLARLLPGIFEWRTHLVLLPLAVFGGLGLPVLMELYDRLFGVRRLSVHSVMVLRWTAGLYIVSFAILLILLWPRQPEDTGEGPPPPPVPIGWAEVRQSIAQSSILSLESRTAGFAFDLVNSAPRAGQWVVALLMVIGASSAGTGGGLKTTTLHTLFRGVRDVFRGRIVRNAFGIAAVWLLIYALFVFVGFLLLLGTDNQLPADRCLFLAISAVSNVGLAHDQVSIVGTGLYILCALMLLGRMTPLLILCWLARRARDADVLVG